MPRSLVPILLSMALWTGGCGPMAVGGVAVADASESSPDAAPACTAADAPTGWTYPPGPYGTQVGDRLADFTLDDCDGSPVRFGDVLGSGQAALIVVAAGWCSSCVNEARTLETAVHQAYCARGVRVLQVLFQDATGNPAGATFCRDWRTTFGLQFPVVVDPSFTVAPWFGGQVDGQTPLNLLVDRDGVIRYRAAGPVPADFDQRIDQLVPP